MSADLDDATIEAIAAELRDSQDMTPGLTSEEYWLDLAREAITIFTKHLPDPRPTEAEVGGAMRTRGGYLTMDVLRDLGCFRPEEPR